MMQTINKFIATVFGIGNLPLAPGTWASIFAVIIWYFLKLDLTQVLAVIVVLAMGIYCSHKLVPIWGKDPSRIVIDEVAGMWISCLFIPNKIPHLILALVLFRLFDIVKPFGIRSVEQLKGGLGIMLDDVLAGIYSNVVLQIILYYHIFERVYEL